MKERSLGEPGEVSYRDQEITFVEMPQFHALSKKTAKSACELPRQDEELVVQAGIYMIHVPDSFNEQTLAAVLRVVANA